jgi:hypothetical protein
VVNRKVAEQMNQMLQAVVLEGTGQHAAHDFTMRLARPAPARTIAMLGSWALPAHSLPACGSATMTLAQ